MAWKGVYPIITTKFTEEDKVDLAAMEQCFAVQIDAGIHGVIVSGSLSEGGFLTREEKKAIVRLFVSVSSGKLPVLSSIGEPATKDAELHARDAQQAGAEGLMVIPSSYYFADERETIANLSDIAAASDLPIMIYNNPGTYRVKVTLDMYEELANNPKFVAIKESSDDIRITTDLINRFGERYQIFGGMDNLALETILAGAPGWAAGVCAAFPLETMAIYHLANAGRLEEAWAIYRWFRPLLDLDETPKLVQNIKLMEQVVLGTNDYVRRPRRPLSGTEREDVLKIIHHALETRPTLPKL